MWYYFYMMRNLVNIKVPAKTNSLRGDKQTESYEYS